MSPAGALVPASETKRSTSILIYVPNAGSAVTVRWRLLPLPLKRRSWRFTPFKSNRVSNEALVSSLWCPTNQDHFRDRGLCYRYRW